MDDSHKQEFATLFYGLGEYYDKAVSTNLLLIYFDDLKRFNLNDVKHAASQHRLDPKHGAFWPKSADIIRHIQTGNISVEDKAELAWAQVMREIRVNGAYGSLKLDDKQALAAIKELGTWKELCATPSDKMTFKHREFIATYKTYERTPIDMLPSSMPGLIELQNHKKKQNEESTNAMLNIKSGIDKHRAKLENK